MEEFGVGDTKASLGLGMYVIGCECTCLEVRSNMLIIADGLGPLLWSPMSEIPILGRNVPYIATFALYVILCVPTALVKNLAGLLVLRFITGLFGSPCLANGGASMQDMVTYLIEILVRVKSLTVLSFHYCIYHTRLRFGQVVCVELYSV